MGMLAVYTTVSNDGLSELIKLNNNELFEACEEVQEEKESEVLDIDKIWDGLHFLLTGVSASEPVPNNPLSEFVVGTSLFSEDEDAEFISYSNKEDVKRILEAVKKINLSELKITFDPKTFSENEIYPNIWDDDKESLWIELETIFNNLLDFYEKNADSNIIVSIF